MPNQDPNQPSSNQSPSMPMHTDLPPLPPAFQSVATDNNIAREPADKPVSEPTVSSVGSAAPPDIPPMITSSPKKKFGTGKIIATILGILLLVGGVGTGVYLTQQSQNPNSRASGGDIWKISNGCVGSGCVGGSSSSSNNSSSSNSSSNNAAIPLDGVLSQYYANTGNLGGDRTVGKEPDEDRAIVNNYLANNTTLTDAQKAAAQQQYYAQIDAAVARNLLSDPPSACTGTGGCTSNGHVGVCQNNICISLDTSCKTGDLGAPACCANPSPSDCGSVVCEGGQQGARQECNIGGQHCTLSVGAAASSCGGTGGGTTTTTTTTTTPTAQCQNIKAYSSTWTLLTTAQLAALTPSTAVNFCVVGSASAGNFDKAKFTINGAVQAETTTVRPGSTDFCQSYTIPAATTTFNISAQIHHVTLGYK